jgi:hypothetical protein
MRRLTNDELELLLSLTDSELAYDLAKLSMEERQSIREQMDAYRTPKERAEASLHEFVKQAWPIVEPEQKFIDGWHIRAICEHLEAATDGRIKRLLINIPPGCCKSLLACVFWPCWVWGPRDWPQSRWLFASYSQPLSTRDSIKCRSIIESPWYQANWGNRVKLVGDQNEKTKFENAAKGWRLATSVGGRGTGEHPDFFVWDDPHNVNDYESQVEREAAIQWRSATMSLRGVTRDVREVGIMQRLHRDDLSGWMKATFGNELDHICLPMRYEPKAMPRATSIGWTDPRAREGELLWPEAMNDAAITDAENQLGNNAEGQFQQRPPTNSDQAMFKGSYFDDNVIWFDEWPENKDCTIKMVACDPRGSAKRQTETRGAVSDFCARVRIALHTSGTLYVDATLDKTDITEAAGKIFSDAVEFFQGFPVCGIACEENFAQVLVVCALDEKIRRAGGAGIGIYPIHHAVNKYLRINNTLNYQLANFRMRFKRGSKGAALLVEQLRELPNGRFDDGPDALEMGVTKMRELFWDNYPEG